MFKFRNFDPATGLARKHARTDEDDTVEKQTDGLADQVIAQDQQARAQELVRAVPPAGTHPLLRELTLFRHLRLRYARSHRT